MSNFRHYEASALNNHTQISRGQPINDTIELESRFSKKWSQTCNEETSKFWQPKHGSAEAQLDDNSSEGGILGAGSPIEVTTTISIVVENKEGPRHSTESTQSLGPMRFGSI